MENKWLALVKAQVVGRVWVYCTIRQTSTTGKEIVIKILTAVACKTTKPCCLGKSHTLGLNVGLLAVRVSASLHDHRRHDVRIAIGRRPAILQVATTLRLCATGMRTEQPRFATPYEN